MLLLIIPEVMMKVLSAAERSQALLLGCLAELESYMKQARENPLFEKTVSEWDALFGAKESVVSVLSKLVSMQKTVMELKERESEQGGEIGMEDMTDADWELIGLCVDRWREGREGSI